MSSDKYITVWHDETSAETGWIVDRCDGDGNSNTVKVFTTEAEARRFAEEHAMPLSPDWVCRACGHQFPTPRSEWGKNVVNMRCPLCLAVSDPILVRMTGAAKSSALASKIVRGSPPHSPTE